MLRFIMLGLVLSSAAIATADVIKTVNMEAKNACNDDSHEGMVRYNPTQGDFEICRNHVTGWEILAPGSGSSTPPSGSIDYSNCRLLEANGVRTGGKTLSCNSNEIITNVATPQHSEAVFDTIKRCKFNSPRSYTCYNSSNNSGKRGIMTIICCDVHP